MYRAYVVFAALIAFLGCSSGGPETAEVRQPLQTGGAGGGGSTFVSDLAFTSSTNGWGPVERDKSNGEKAAGDGHTITIKGVTYAKGLGVHAASDVRVNVAGQYSSFVSDIGVDDEVGANGGSVVFQVWLDGVKAFDSGTVRGRQAARHVTVPLTNVTQLRLVVTDSGDGNSYDHADWAGAQVVAGGTAGSGGSSGAGGASASGSPGAGGAASGGSSAGGAASAGSPGAGGAASGGSGGASSGGTAGSGGSPTGGAYVRQMNQASQVGAGVQDISATLPMPVLAGSTLVVFVTEYNISGNPAGSGPPDPVVMTDNQGGSYTLLKTVNSQPDWQAVLAYVRQNVSAGTVTPHAHFAGLEWQGIAVAEIAGVGPSSLLGSASQFVTTTGSTPPPDGVSSGSISLSGPALLVGFSVSTSAWGGPPAAGSAFSSAGVAWNWGGAEGTANAPSARLESAHFISSSAGAKFTSTVGGQVTVDREAAFAIAFSEPRAP